MSMPAGSTLRLARHEMGRLAVARSWLRNALGGLRDSGAELVLTELLSNAIEHGTGGPIDVSLLEITAKDVTIRVENEVDPSSFSLPNVTDKPPPVSNVRGRGLHLVRSIGILSIERDGTIVSMTAAVPLGAL